MNVRVNEPSMKGSINHLDFQLEGINSHINIRSVNDGTGHKRVLMRLDDDTPLVQELLKKLQVSGGDENIHPKYPVMRFTLPEPKDESFRSFDHRWGRGLRYMGAASQS